MKMVRYCMVVVCATMITSRAEAYVVDTWYFKPHTPESLVYEYYLHYLAQTICAQALHEQRYDIALQVGNRVYGPQWREDIKDVVPAPNRVCHENIIIEAVKSELRAVCSLLNIYDVQI